ncbi:Protein UXT [Taenia crassiceps]|uniref:Protein UXT n=1 Tax=Taenia crassiceps TaxID=6207 RepID=A0ABR4QT91_9CEST
MKVTTVNWLDSIQILHNLIVSRVKRIITEVVVLIGLCQIVTFQTDQFLLLLSAAESLCLISTPSCIASNMTNVLQNTAKEEKIVKIENFINEKLRRDLRLTLDAGDAVYAEISEYLELQNLLEKFCEVGFGENDNGGVVETMVDMGCNFYLKAQIPSMERLYVDVGLGFHVELTRAEALDFVRQRVELLTARAELFRQKAFEIRARIKVCLQGLRELQTLDMEPRPDFYDVLA